MNTPKREVRDAGFYDLQTAVKKMLDGVDGRGMMKSCLNCTFWREDTEICGKFNQRPPAPIIVNACKEYSDCDDIPF